MRFAGACRRDGPFDFLAGIAPWPAGDDWPGFVQEAMAAMRPQAPDLTAWRGRHAARLLRLRHLLPDERRAILEDMLVQTQRRLEREREQLAIELLPPAEAMVNAGMGLPVWMKTVLEATWSQQLARVLEKLDGVTDPARYAPAMDVVTHARHLGLGLDLVPAATWFERMLVRRLEAIAEDADVRGWQEYLELLHIAGRLALPLQEQAIQDRMFNLLRNRLPELLDTVRDPNQEVYALVTAILTIAARLNLNTDGPRERLRPLEKRVAEDPTYWP